VNPKKIDNSSQHKRSIVNCGKGQRLRSRPLHKTIHHALFAGLVEGDGELVAVDVDDVAVAEFLVEHAVADREGGGGAGGFGDQFAFDGERAAAAGGVAAEIRTA
jgi:hypothetical protein